MTLVRLSTAHSLINAQNYRKRAAALASYNNDPSEADQAGSDDTDINVIVKRYGVYGTVPSGMKAPQFGADLSAMPTDLADLIATARSLETLRGELPPELAATTIEELLAFTPQELAAILTPPTKAELKTEETK